MAAPIGIAANAFIKSPPAPPAAAPASILVGEPELIGAFRTGFDALRFYGSGALSDGGAAPADPYWLIGVFIGAAAWAAGVATLTVHAPAGPVPPNIVVGELIVVSGVNNNNYNGSFIATAFDPIGLTVSYALATNPGGNSYGGQVTLQAIGQDLGGYRSSQELSSLAAFGAMENITIQRVGENNQPGPGALESDGKGNLRWTAPGSSTPGAYKQVGIGATVNLEDGADPGSSLRVGCAGSLPAQGTRPVKLLEIFNGDFGSENIPSVSRVAGGDWYRAVFLKNMSLRQLMLRIYLNAIAIPYAVGVGGYAAAGAVTVPVSGAMDDWPTSGVVINSRTGETLYYNALAPAGAPTGLTVAAAGRDFWGEVAGGIAGLQGDMLYPVSPLRFALELPASQPGSIQSIAFETTAPAGRTWLHPYNEVDPNVLVLNLSPGNIAGLWLDRRVLAGAVAMPLVQNQVVVDHF